jgi:deazaflavin-dependent oxidoreductase (nitroreductase family)
MTEKRLLLTTRGATSGKVRINPLAFTRDGDNYVIIASKGASPTHPDWYHTVPANAKVGVEVVPHSGAALRSARIGRRANALVGYDVLRTLFTWRRRA